MKIILASKSEVRKKILDKHDIPYYKEQKFTYFFESDLKPYLPESSAPKSFEENEKLLNIIELKFEVL